MSKPWGLHLVLDLKGCIETTNVSRITDFLQGLVESIDMVAVGPPICTKFSNLSKEKNGWTVIQLIQTSSIVMHFCDEGDAYIDIFSCKEFEQGTVIDHVDAFFKPTEIRSRILERG